MGPRWACATPDQLFIRVRNIPAFACKRTKVNVTSCKVPAQMSQLKGLMTDEEYDSQKVMPFGTGVEVETGDPPEILK